MTDIYPIKDSLLLLPGGRHTIIYIFITGIIILTLRKIHTSKKSPLIIEEDLEEELNINDYLAQLQELEENISKYTKDEFYNTLHHIIREYLTQIGYKNIENIKTMTLVELKNEELQSVYTFLKNTYFLEFDTSTPTATSKQKHLQNTRKFILDTAE